MQKIKIFDVDEENSQVFKISLVEDPAVSIGMVYLEKDQKPINFSTNEEKHLVYSVALRSNFPIYRFDGENEYYIKFSDKAVEKLSRDFLKNGYQKCWSTDHETDVDGLTVVESWIVTDPEKDKSIALGMDKNIGKGDWIVGCYVEDSEVWQRIKNGDFGGFSVEAFCDFTEINKFKQDKGMEINETFWDRLKSIVLEALSTDKSEEVKDEELEAEAPEAPEAVEEETVEEAVEEAAEEIAEDVADEAMTEEEVEQVVEEVAEQIAEEHDAPDLQAIVDELQAKVDELVAENEKLKAANEKLSKEPSTKKLNVNASNSSKGSFLDFASGRVRY